MEAFDAGLTGSSLNLELAAARGDAALKAAQLTQAQGSLEVKEASIKELNVRIKDMSATLQAKEHEKAVLELESQRKDAEVSNLMWRIKDLQRQMYQKQSKMRDQNGGCFGYRSCAE